MAFVSDFLDRVAPKTQPDRRRRATVLVLFGGLLVGQCVIWSLGHATSGGTVLAVAFATCGLATSLLLYSLSRGLSITSVGHITLSFANAMVGLATWFTGGLRLTNVTPFFSLVIAAIFVLGRSGLGWAVVALLGALGFQIAEWAGVSFPDVVPPDQRSTDAFLTWLFAGLLILLYAYLYESARAIAARTADEANEARDQFLANLSHEIRTPLHVILAFQDELERADPERHEEIMTVLRANTAQLRELLDDLLELARGESSGFVLQTRDFDPVATIESVRLVVEPMARDRGLTLKVSTADDVPRWVHGDPHRLHQVLMNLADNAVKYTDEGTVRLEAARDDDRLLIRVSDTGVGIPEAAQAAIFDKFTRLEPTLEHRHRGVGLGLPIARSLVDAMGGTLAVESTPGVGSSFEVVIPLTPARAARSDREMAPTSSAGARASRILVVEDNDLNRDVARLMLARLGAEVVCANNGLEALELWAEYRPELVLMDIQMPEMDGIAATREIRRREEENGSPRTRIVATTGYVTTASNRELVDAGVDEVLVKPFAAEQLAQVLAHQPPSGKSTS